MPKAMILAAGMGTRLKPLTSNRPKALVELNQRPLIDHVIRRLQAYGYTDIIVNLHHHGNMLAEYLEKEKYEGIHISISDESLQLLDTGGGIKNARWFFDDQKTFLVHNCDVLSKVPLDEMLKQHTDSNAIATLAVSRRSTSRPLAFDKDMRLKGRFETTESSQAIREELHPLAFSGIYILDSKIFGFMPDKEIFSIIEVLIEAAITRLVMAFEHDASIWMDIGSVNNLERAVRFP